MTAKDKKQLIAIGVGAAGLAILLPLNLLKVRQQKQKRLQQVEQTAKDLSQGAEPAPVAVKPAVTLGPQDEALRKLQQAVLEKGWGPDPFLIQKQATPTSETLLLKGVSVLADGRGMAVINDSIVGVGDEVEGHTVRRIAPKQVILEKEGREFILKFQGEEEEG